MSWFTRKNQKGFTLIELLLALAILGVVTYFIVSLTSSVRHGGKVGETKQRMEIISAKMKEYYRHQGELPVPAGTGDDEVPVDALNLEAKFRFDGWGQPIRYYVADDIVIDGTASPLPANAYRGVEIDISDIRGVTVDGVGNMAGYLLSFGGDQEIDVEDDLGDIDDVITSAGDDILMAINVNREAMEIALDEVRELQRRVNQFDNLFDGPDACKEVVDDDGTATCPPVNPPYGNYDPDPAVEANDPNCGTATLDQIQEEDGIYSCDTAILSGRPSGFIEDALSFIVAYYGLADNYLYDPWGRPYQWGCSEDICSVAAGPRFGTGDKQYRKFFSLGPDGCTWSENVGSGEGFCAGIANPTTNDDYEKDDIIP